MLLKRIVGHSPKVDMIFEIGKVLEIKIKDMNSNKIKSETGDDIIEKIELKEYSLKIKYQNGKNTLFSLNSFLNINYNDSDIIE